MSSSFEDSVFNFDFNLLHQSTKNVGVEYKVDKIRKDIYIAKKKISATDSLIKKYFSKSELLEQTEKLLQAAKEECKQVCIDYNAALEKCAKWEKDAQSLSTQNRELQERLNFTDNQCKAIESHANQLQILVHQHETQIESLKIENQLEKCNMKEQIKTTSAHRNEYDNIINDVCLLRDIVLGKQKVHKHHKKILKKYEKFKTKFKVDDGSTSDASDEEMDIFDCTLPSSSSSSNALYHNKLEQDEKLSKSSLSNNLDKDIHNDDIVDKKYDGDHDSDSGNEIISEDTGCGSSLGCSDSEKCFNSPDYFINDSPFSTIAQREKKNFVEVTTSPITVPTIQTETATSPISFDNSSNHNILCDIKSTQDIGIAVDPNDFITKKSIGTGTVIELHLDKATSPVHFVPFVNNIESCIVKNLGKDRASSPIHFDYDINETEISFATNKQQERGSSPIHFANIVKTTGTNTVRNIQNNVATSPLHFDNMHSIKSTVETLSNECKCLEVNNSLISNESYTDCEVETILSTMRLDHELITPIPKSPAKSQSQSNIRKSQVHVCQDAAKVSAENDVLKASIADLAKEIFNIKCLLKNHLLLSEQELNNSNVVCNDIIMDSIVPMSTSSANITNKPDEEVLDTLDIAVVKQATPGFVKSLYTNETQTNVKEVDHIQSNNEQSSKDSLYKTSVNTLDKANRAIKLSRLEKLRKKLLPKYKIQRAMTPPIRKVKRKNQFIFKKKKIGQYSMSVQDNKLAYENAVKVMAEIRDKERQKKDQEKNKNIKKPSFSNVHQDCKRELHVVLSKCDNIVLKDVNHSNPSISPNKSTVSKDLSIQNNATVYNNVTPVNVGNTVTPINEEDSKVSSMTTRSCRKRLLSELSTNSDPNCLNTLDVSFEQKENDTESEVPVIHRQLKRLSSDKLESKTKRMLRSSGVPQTLHLNNNAVNETNESNESFNQVLNIIDTKRRSNRLSTSPKNEISTKTNSEGSKVIVVYNDLDLFSAKCFPENSKNASKEREKEKEKVQHPKESILCRMLEKYAKYSIRCYAKKLPEAKINFIAKQLEEGIAHILTIPQLESKQVMNAFVNEIQKINKRYLLAGLIKYLKDPARKDELFNKVNAPPAPLMTKSEQVLLYVIKQLQVTCTFGNFIESILTNIEFALFQLNHTPDFGTVESLSHFYAIVCRFIGAKSRLRLFILDAMYCIQFKSVVLIKQCLEVWMPILPLAHVGIAKSPLVTCLVYLLHFFKCEDRFHRVQEIRDILCRKYFYQVSEWTETNILEMFKNAVNEIQDIPVEKKMLRMSLIILAKRRGPQWTQKNIVKKILQPFIEAGDTPERVKEFCIIVLGPLLKPYPNDMKVHCEIVVNQLLEMLESNITPLIKEAIFSSLLYMRRHNQNRVTQALLNWNPDSISPELELLLKDYIREKPAKAWKTTLSRISVM